MFRWRYKKYPLEVCGNPINGFQYFLFRHSCLRESQGQVPLNRRNDIIYNM